MVETNVHAGVVSGNKGGQKSIEYEGSGKGCRARADPVDTIVRGPEASEGGWMEVVVKLVVDLHMDVAQTREHQPLLRSDGLPVSSHEADTPDEIVQAGFGEELVIGVQ